MIRTTGNTLAGAIVILGAVSAARGDRVLHVDDDAAPGGNGLAWTSAMRHLRDAIDAAAPGSGVTAIHVARGTYRPNAGDGFRSDDRASTFSLVEGVALLGGYAGINALDPAERDPARFPTVLSGDLGGDDGPGFENMAENAFHVVSLSDAATPTRFEGFVVTGGNADGAEYPDDSGGGLLADRSNPLIVDCTFTSNVARRGAAVRYFNGRTSLVRCRFERNAAVLTGGGVMSCCVTEPGEIVDCVFESNTVAEFHGGAINHTSDLLISGCTFRDNVAYGSGGAMFLTGNVTVVESLFQGNEAIVNYGGAIHAGEPSSATLALDRCTFAANAAVRGGAVYLRDCDAATWSDCRFRGNAAELGGALLMNSSSGELMQRCTFEANRAERGGACYILSFAEVRDCRFERNTATVSDGGAISFVPSRLVDCAFIGNTAAGRGGALFDRVVTSPVEIIGCELRANASGGAGGAIANERPAGDLSIVNTVIAGNHAAGDGGAVHHFRSSGALVLRNCTVMGNTAEGAGGGVSVREASTHVINSIVYDNEDVEGGGEPAQVHLGEDAAARLDYSCIAGLTGSHPGLGSIGVDPQWRDPLGGDGIPGTGDEDLRLGATSPCLDAGHNWGAGVDTGDLDDDGDTAELLPVDREGAPRFADAVAAEDTGCGEPVVIDIGAFEHDGEPAAPRWADVTADGSVGFADVLAVLATWGPCSACCRADLDLSGEIDFGDLLAVLGAWDDGSA